MNTVMIITGESSGELYGSLLAQALKIKYPDVHILGVGGDRMSKSGVELISRISGAFGLIELLTALKDLKVTFKRTTEAIKKFMPHVLVLIDYPDFNIKVAEFAKTLGIKILYYVSPQVWAWRKGRVKKIAGLVDRMAVVLPFEAEIYRKAGVPCEFVGHPIVEEIETVLQSTIPLLPPFTKNPPSPPFTKEGKEGITDSRLTTHDLSLDTLSPKLRKFFKTFLGLDADLPLLSLLPGSRPHELKRLLPLMIEVVRQLKKEFSNYQFCIPLAPNTDEGKYSHYLEALKQEGAVVKKGESIRALAASDMAVIASGTATLQAAFLEVPMVVVYRLSPSSYYLGRLLIDVKYISLVNILSGREVVPELIQQGASPEGIIKELKKIMIDMPYKEEMVKYYRLIKEPFLGLRASKRATEIIGEMAGWELQKQ
jgi:lipid-A-disaccharide synthase